LHEPETLRLIAAFQEAGYPLRFVGGVVRDALLGRPITDVDAATPAPPQKIMAILEQAGIKAIPTGISHGTITAVIQHKPFEITTLRRDVKPFGRHAEVLFTDNWQEDALRRDFTMNALYADAEGVIYDFTGGINDALAGRVVFIGEPQRRIEEDALRILRFFRFHAHYASEQCEAIDAAALAACQTERHRLGQLSGERITAEMLKLLTAEHAPVVLLQMHHAMILAEIIVGELNTQSLKALSRVRLMADYESIDPFVLLALMLRHAENEENATGSSIVTTLLPRWRLSSKQAAWLDFLITTPPILPQTLPSEQKKLLRHHGAEGFIALVLISWCEQLAQHPAQAQNLAANYREMLTLATAWHPPLFPLSGKDLQEIGIPTGAAMGQLLATLEQEWEASDYRLNREELLVVASRVL
jgi:poly(A) polymerase